MNEAQLQRRINEIQSRLAVHRTEWVGQVKIDVFKMKEELLALRRQVMNTMIAPKETNNAYILSC